MTAASRSRSRRVASAACALGLVLALAACRGGGGTDDDPRTDAARAVDARRPTDAAIDAASVDAAVTCHPLELTAAEACARSLTGAVTPCSIDPVTGVPSQTGALEVRRGDGATGYLCTTGWVDPGGFFFQADRRHFAAAPTACCGGPVAPLLDWPATDPHLGVPHAPTHIKVQELDTRGGGPLVENPFAIVVRDAAAAATVHPQRLAWLAWAGDGVPHPAPDGTGRYWFPNPLPVNYVVVPTATGEPLIVVAPEVTLDPSYTQPLGHPTMGACADRSGAPVAFLGGTIAGTVLTNRSGRFGRETSITRAHLEGAAALFNCQGITITGVDFNPP